MKKLIVFLFIILAASLSAQVVYSVADYGTGSTTPTAGIQQDWAFDYIYCTDTTVVPPNAITHMPEAPNAIPTNNNASGTFDAMTYYPSFNYWAPAGISCQPSGAGSPGQAEIAHFVYVRAYNATTREAATQYIDLLPPMEILGAPASQTGFIQDGALVWGPWANFAMEDPAPDVATGGMPRGNNVAQGLTQITWTAPTAGESFNGYKVTVYDETNTTPVVTDAWVADSFFDVNFTVNFATTYTVTVVTTTNSSRSFKNSAHIMKSSDMNGESVTRTDSESTLVWSLTIEANTSGAGQNGGQGTGAAGAGDNNIDIPLGDTEGLPNATPGVAFDFVNPGETVIIDVELGVDPDTFEDLPEVPEINLDGQFAAGLVITASAIEALQGTITFTIGTEVGGINYVGYADAGGNWVFLTPGVDWTYAGGVITITGGIVLSRATELVLGAGEGDWTLPVELASFLAVYNAEEFVVLSWVTASESNMQSYEILRNATDDVTTASRITTIAATNSSNGHNYTWNDVQIEDFAGKTAYYWLQSTELNGTVKVQRTATVTIPTGSPSTEAPNVTSVEGNYPNPFNGKTEIRFELKNNEPATLTIFNVKGQLVVERQLSGTETTYDWNGLDNTGNTVGSGVYFMRLDSKDSSITKKMLKIK